MFIGVRISGSASTILRYHENKITKGSARLIHAENFLQRTSKLTEVDKLERFKLLNTLNHRTKGNMVQAVLSFAEGHSLSDDKLIAIGKRFSETMGLQDQPFLVYLHEDTRHAHMHFVANTIKPDGRRIDVYTQVKQRREQIRHQLEQEFHVAEKEEARAETQKAGAKKVNYGKVPMYEGMVSVLNKVIDEYNFTSLNEFDAILRGYNVSVLPIAHGRGNKRPGLIYRTLDDNGQAVGKIMPASSFENKPTWRKLEGCCVKNARAREEKQKDMSNRVKWVLFQEPNDRHELSEAFRKEGIHLEIIPGKGAIDDQPILVDHQSRIAVRVADLDKKEEILRLVGKTKGLAVAREGQSLELESNHKIKRHV
ncbi:MAG: relaxase/mobilization nuclease domain-containing protein [Bacteroidota bacterium]|nr:relaxase/mobilization nuclease domain-containing protein [Bacteroidota bacterium]MDP4245684.1 relaxase/mobilization nuclease domain-containing protein [Bacteroidota bacterium]MDP4259920.1 relaxase/mobilization nuclease domain-containing protein [Bacteroidota bacterium]